MAGPWEKYGGSSAPAFVPLTGPDPRRAEDRAYRAEDQQFQREAAERAERAEQRAERAEQRQMTRDQVDVAAKVTEGERKASAFLTRALGANRSYEDTGVGPRGLVGQFARDVAPDVSNYFNSDERQVADSAQDEFIAASLRQDSGAAIPTDELEKQRRIYFPMPGDGPEALEQKRQARLRAIDGLVQSAGKSITPEQRAALEAYGDQLGAAVSGQGLPKDLSEIVDRAVADEQPQGLAVDVSADPTPEEAERMRQSRRESEEFRNSSLGNVDAFVRGAADTVTLGLSDEIAAAGNTIFSGGTMAENLARERATDAYDAENNFYARTGGQLAGGLALPGFGATTAGQLARVGGGYGAAYGFGSGEGTVGDRLVNAGKGAAIGVGSGYVFGLIGQGIRGGGGGGSRTRAVELAEAANRQGVDVLPADVGGPMTRRFTAGAAQLPFAAGPIVRGAERVGEQSAAARDRIAAGVGNAVDPVEAGEAAVAGSQRYISESSTRGGRLYQQADELAGDARIDPALARETLDASIAELSQSPLGAPQALTNLRQNLEGTFTVRGLRNLRTQLRDEFAATGLRGSDAERRGMEAVQALTEDIASGLVSQGNDEAARAYRVADQHWRDRLNVIDEVLKPIIGDGSKSGEEVIRSIQGAARTNGARLGRFINALPAEEQATLRATLISQLGRASAGTQNAEGSAFSLGQFLTQWNQMTPRAKDVLFKGETRSALDDLAKVAEGSKAAGAYANRSNTGGAGNVASVLGGIGTAGFSIPAELITGRILASARFARFLARPPQDRGRAIKRLSQIAAREPSIAQDIIPLQRALEAAAPLRAAAEQKEDRR